MIRIIDILMVLLPIVLIAIALLLACALRVTRWRRTVDRRAGFGRAAGDPFQYPFGEMPLVHSERVSFEYGRGGRMRDASDFRAWGIPRFHSGGFVGSEPGPLVGERCESFPMTPRQYERLVSAGALRRNESGGRPASLSGTAVVLTFPRMLKAEEVDQIKAARQHQIEEIARVFGGSMQRDA